MLFKVIRSNTWEERFAQFFMFGKLASFILFVFCDTKFAFAYGLLYLVVMCFVKMPMYNGISKLVRFLTKDPKYFYQQILNCDDEKTLITGLKAE